MIVLHTIRDLRETLEGVRARGGVVGLVPTMGYLHEGHLSLMRRSVEECDFTVATIFVNPLQFAPGEDYDRYPRDPEGDSDKARSAGVDVLFMPPVEEMYPRPVKTTVHVDVAVGFMESAARPTHFDGVATVVAKLFAIVGPCRAYFGEKDFQQLVIVRRMAHDLSFPVEVVGCPIVREPDGLAASSRNVYLNVEQRSAATVLYRALCEGVEAIRRGERDAEQVRRVMAEVVSREPSAELDYAEVVDPETLERCDRLEGEVRLLIAVRLGDTRLLDNLGVVVPEGTATG
ncbi:MAG: pantoate--beta-alanine ligase [Acidimicrobiales bacterium]|nr:MAG: pantoate--beta-alanine ligase [Acidimicrobiales bacterium]